MKCPHCWKDIEKFKPFVIVYQVSKWEYNCYFHHKENERFVHKVRRKKEIIEIAKRYGITKSRISYEEERLTLNEWFAWLRTRELHYRVFR